LCLRGPNKNKKRKTIKKINKNKENK
jgi:hypothetical protein